MEGKRVAVITGSNSGIGLETALLFAVNGYITYATVRHESKQKDLLEAAEQLPNLSERQTALANLKIVEVDLVNDSTIINTFKTILGQHQKIDVLVNNAGYACRGSCGVFNKG